MPCPFRRYQPRHDFVESVEHRIRHEVPHDMAKRHGRRMRSEVRLIGFPDADVLRRSSDPVSPDHSDLTDHSEPPDHEEPSR